MALIDVDYRDVINKAERLGKRNALCAERCSQKLERIRFRTVSKANGDLYQPPRCPSR